MRNFMSDRGLQRVVLIFADQVEEPTADIHVSAWMRESIHSIAVEDCELVRDVLAEAGLE